MRTKQPFHKMTNTTTDNGNSALYETLIMRYFRLLSKFLVISNTGTDASASAPIKKCAGLLARFPRISKASDSEKYSVTPPIPSRTATAATMSRFAAAAEYFNKK